MEPPAVPPSPGAGVGAGSGAAAGAATAVDGTEGSPIARPVAYFDATELVAGETDMGDYGGYGGGGGYGVDDDSDGAVS